MRLAPLLAIALAACGHPTPAEPVPAMERAFQAAAARTDVPRDLLAAMAYTESRLDGRAGAADEHGHVGVMGLRSDDSPEDGPTLAEAAELAGVAEAALIADSSLQVLGAAELLRAYAIEDLGAAPTNLQDWWPVVERYSGSDDAQVSAEFANDVFRSIETGFVTRTHDGERVEVAGRYVPGLMSYRDDRAATDYAGAAAFSPAATCNYQRGGRTDIDKIVLHTVQGGYSSCINWFKNCSAGASAHYVVRSSDGQVTQMVDESDTAWHAGNSNMNHRSVGIELEGYMENPDAWFTDAQYRSAAALTRDIAARQGVPLDRSHIVGHDEVPDPDGSGWGGAGGHTDPGDGFNWTYFMALVTEQAPAEVSAQRGDLYGFVRIGDAETGQAIPGASVVLQDGQSTIADSGGMFRFYGLDAGAWTVSAHASGFSDAATFATVRPDAIAWGSVALDRLQDTTTQPPAPAPTTSGAPGQPSALGPTTDQYDDAVHLTWTDQGARTDVHEVELWVKVNGDWLWYYTWTEGASDKWFWPYRRNVAYSFRVRGKNGTGWGEYSGWQDFNVH